MKKEEFLLQLREALRGNVSQRIINDNLNYYENYILQELRKGKAEEDIIGELGNPRLLAQTIIDTADADVNEGKNNYEKKRSYENNQSYEDDNRYRDNGWGYNRVLTGGKAKLILIAIVVAIVLVIVGVVLLIGGLISVVAPFIIPLILIMLIIRIMGRRR